MEPIEVRFLSSNLSLSGHLYLPPTATSTSKHPAIAVAHPASGVKEQTAGTYARELSSQGFVTLAFDRRTQGASEGIPRNMEEPFDSIEDIKSAVTYLTTHANVDASRIGVLGICAGGGYSIRAASTDRRIKALGTVSMACIGRLFNSAPKQDLDLALDNSGKARTEYAKTGNVKYVPLLPAIDARDGLGEKSLMYQGSEYYLTPRGGHPRSVARFVAWSYDTLLAYDSFAKIEGIAPRPLLMVAGGDADTLHFSKTALEMAKEPKELFVVEGATHVDLYDYKVNEALPKLTEFYKKNL